MASPLQAVVIPRDQIDLAAHPNRACWIVTRAIEKQRFPSDDLLPDYWTIES